MVTKEIDRQDIGQEATVWVSKRYPNSSDFMSTDRFWRRRMAKYIFPISISGTVSNVRDG
jgi:hypothetical protein